MLSASSAVSAFLLLLLLVVLLVLLVLLASAAGASAASAAAAAAAATALRTAGWSCSVLFFILTLLRKLYGVGCCCTEPSEKSRVRI